CPGRLMQSFLASAANSYYANRIHPALTSFADECCGMLARLMAYVGTLALLVIVGVHLWDRLPEIADTEPSAQAGWNVASRQHPAFAVSQLDSSDKTESYEILRHPGGGRKDVFRWGPAGIWPAAELEIYRPGAELASSRPAAADLAARMGAPTGSDGRSDLEAAGVIDSKFGHVTLLRLAGGADGARSCLGFVKRVDEPGLQISGWSCQGETLPARRAAISCMLNRLVLLTAGNDAKLAELFARAELKRGSCASATSAVSADWVTAAQNPLLRGRL
ncbi:MAG: hypothetical protein JWR80_4181, partial [Bradyrhizobium sp.]|nr:hypothetical protein [Bradyrhizobium sp.]